MKGLIMEENKIDYDKLDLDFDSNKPKKVKKVAKKGVKTDNVVLNEFAAESVKKEYNANQFRAGQEKENKLRQDEIDDLFADEYAGNAPSDETPQQRYIKHLVFSDKTGMITGVGDWPALAQDVVADIGLISHNNAIYHKQNKKDNYQLITTKIKGFITRYLSQLELNINPKITSDIAVKAMDWIPHIKSKTKDNVIYFKNGEYNVSTDEFKVVKDQVFNNRILPWDFKQPKDKNSIKIFNNFIGQFSGSDKDKAMQLIEIIGAAMLPTKIFRKAFFFEGPGGNGKSGYMDFLSKVIGEEHVSTMSLQDLSSGRKFDRLPLVGKMANIIDDLDSINMKETGAFKTLVAGGKIAAEVKGGNVIDFANEATIIASGNSLPHMKDGASSTAIMDRLVVIKLENKIKKDLEKYNRVMQPDIFEVAAYGAAKAMHRASKRDYTITQTTESIQALRELELEQDSVMRFVEEHPNMFRIELTKYDTAYGLYMDFMNGARGTVNKNNFSKGIYKRLPHLIKRRPVEQGKKVSYFYNPKWKEQKNDIT